MIFYFAAFRRLTLVFSNTFTSPSSHSGNTSPFSSICSFTKAERLLAFTVSYTRSPKP